MSPSSAAAAAGHVAAAPERRSAFGGCLVALLSALHWTGTRRHLQNVMPSSGALETVLDLRAALFRLGFKSEPSSATLGRLSQADLPCLFTPKRIPNECWVVLEAKPNGRLHIYSGRTEQFHEVDAAHDGRVYAVRPVDPVEQNARNQSWVRHAVSQESGTIAKLFALTFIINVLAVSLALYVMAVYDKAVFAHSNLTLAYLFLGIMLFIGLEFTLREARARGLAYLGARMESLITVTALQRVLHLPASAVEQSALSTQLSRLKMFESVRDAFSGPVASTLLDLPFILIFVAVVFAIGGSIGWIVAGFAAAMAALVFFYGPIVRFRTSRAAQANAERRKFLAEFTEHLETIRNCRIEDIWLRRNHELSIAQLKTQAELQRLNFTEHSLSHVLFLLAGTSIVFFGAIQVMHGAMTPGALVGLMALTWRVLAPVQTLFLNFTKIGQSRDVLRQIDQLMRLPVEYEPDSVSLLPRKFTGRLAAEGVVFRYANRPEPTLRGATLSIGRGECVALAGLSGSGKSTLLKLFAGLYPIQAGGLYIDGLDLRQIDPRDLRQNLGFLEEKQHVFSGSLAENLRLSHPEISDEEILRALVEFEVLPLDAEIGDIHAPVSVLSSDSLLRLFSLARVFIKDVPIYLLDEPSLYLDADADAVLRQKIERLKGKATIIMATVQPAYMRLATRVILMQAGRVWMEGPPDAIIPVLMQQPQQGAPELPKAPPALPRPLLKKSP
jgi:ABC-type bacteriocin/lantibiotic exporter with double-glycine peptidase domain